MKLLKKLLLISALATIAFAAFGCGQAEEEAPTGPNPAVTTESGTTGDAPGKGAAAPTDAQAAPPGVATGTPNGK